MLGRSRAEISRSSVHGGADSCNPGSDWWCVAMVCNPQMFAGRHTGNHLVITRTSLGMAVVVAWPYCAAWTRPI